jgi:hypothetical protein
MNALEHKIPPPIILIFSAIAMWVLAHFTRVWHVPLTIKLVLILLFIAVALFFGPSAIMTFRKNKTTIDPVRIDRASSMVHSISRAIQCIYRCWRCCLLGWFI